MVRRIIGLFVCTLAAPATVVAQDVWVAAATGHASHQFSDAPETDRLEGAAPGLRLLAGVRVWGSVAARVEWSRDSEMTDRESLALDIAGRTVTIESTLTQRTRVLTALGGFTHALSTRARITYLAGAAFTHLERRFETNAPGLVLGGRAPLPSATSIQEDDFVAFAGGADAIIRLWNALNAVTGIRLQELKLDPELSGRRISVFAGVAWVF
jgi:hypothetical protein